MTSRPVGEALVLLMALTLATAALRFPDLPEGARRTLLALAIAVGLAALLRRAGVL